MLFLDQIHRTHAGCTRDNSGSSTSAPETQSTREETSSDADAVQTLGQSRRLDTYLLAVFFALFVLYVATRVARWSLPLPHQASKWPPRPKVITLLRNRRRAVKVQARTALFASRRSCASFRRTSLRTSSGRVSPPGWTMIRARGKHSMRAS